jgi:hypothetical protein
VNGRFNLAYCGNGSFSACRSDIWQAIHTAADGLATTFGSQDPATWLKAGDRTGFQPGLIPNTMRTTNRPTFQQVLEFQHSWRWGWGRGPGR